MNSAERSRVVATALLAVILILFPGPIDAQSRGMFRADARLVVVHVSVSDRHDEMVTDLRQEAFEVYENGTRQPIAIFRGDDVPVSLGIVIDNSGSMRARRTRVEAAALAFARASNPLDEMFVVNFADKPHIDVPLTNDIRQLEAGIARIDSIGGTALRDAVLAAVAYLDEHGTRDRKALLLISDGYDNTSTEPMDRLRRQAAQSGVAIYAVALPLEDASKAKRAAQELDDLAEHSGGAVVHLESMDDDDLDRTILRLARQLRQQYTLAYAPLNQALDGSYRKIKVVVKGHKGLSVRSRAGYYATPRSSGASGG